MAKQAHNAHPHTQRLSTARTTASAVYNETAQHENAHQPACAKERNEKNLIC